MRRIGGGAIALLLSLWPGPAPLAQKFIGEEYAFWAPLARSAGLKLQ